MIFHKHKCIFVHIPKTGGSSIERWFESNGNTYLSSEKHLLLPKTMRIYRKYWDEYTKFTIVRNPWARVYSVWYNYTVAGKTKVGLTDFAKNARRDFLLTPQYNWLMVKNGVQFDMVGRFEDLMNFFELLRKRFKLRGEVPTYQVRENKPHYTEVYEKKAIDIVARDYKNDIETWGYDYGD